MVLQCKAVVSQRSSRQQRCRGWRRLDVAATVEKDLHLELGVALM